MVTQFSKERRLRNEEDAASPTRGNLAAIAYPDLVRKADRFRFWIKFLSLCLILWLFATCLVSWVVAENNRVASQLALAQTEYDTARAAVENTQVTVSNPAPQQGRGEGVGAVPTQPSLAPSPVRRAEAICTPANMSSRTSGAANGPPYVSGTLLAACRAFEQTRQRRGDLTRLLCSNRDDGDSCLLRVNWWLGVIGNGLLPVLYGVLGAGAAFLRSLSRKLKASTLSPRDLNILLLQLGLGALMGACIGLFVTQPSANGQDAADGLGMVALSSSAISFIAGFGVNAVFKTLERIIDRVFNIENLDSPAEHKPTNAA